MGGQGQLLSAGTPRAPHLWEVSTDLQLVRQQRVGLGDTFSIGMLYAPACVWVKNSITVCAVEGGEGGQGPSALLVP